MGGTEQSWHHLINVPICHLLQASDRMIRRFTPSPAIEDMKQIAAIDKTDLTQSILGLQFWVTSEHFQSGKLKVWVLLPS